MARQFVCAYFDWLETLKRCTDEELGRLLRAALTYARDGSKPSFAEGTREDLYWWGIASQIDRDIGKYDRRAKAGEKGNEVRWGKKNKSPEQKPADPTALPPTDIQAYIDKIKAWKNDMESGGTLDK